MRTLAQSITELDSVKTDIKDAIVSKGQEVPIGTPFADYAPKITAIQTGANITGKTVVTGVAKENIAIGDSTYRKYLTGIDIPMSVPDTPIIPNISYVEYSPDGNYVIMGEKTTSTSPLRVYRVTNETLTLLSIEAPRGGLHTIRAISWCPDSSHFLVSTDYPDSYLYRNNNDNTFTRVVMSFSGGNVITGFHFSPDGLYMALVEPVNKGVYKRNGETYTKIHSLSNMDIDSESRNTCAWNYDSHFLVCPITSSPYCEVLRRDGDAFTSIGSPATFGSSPFGFTFHPLTNMLFIILETGTGVFCYRINANYSFSSVITTFGVFKIAGITISPDGSKIVIFKNDYADRFQVYSFLNDTITYLVNLPYGTRGDWADFSHDGKYLILANVSSPGITIIRMESELGIYKLNNVIPPYSAVCDIGFSEQVIASGQTGEMVSILRGTPYPV